MVEPQESLAAHARELLGGNRYLTLGTVGRDGRPWTSPVYFAWSDAWEFYWMSTVDALHSRNLAERSAVSISVFDSTVPAYHGRAVYAVGDAREAPSLERALEVYPGPLDRGGAVVDREDVTGSSPWRVYRMVASELWVVCPREPRQSCPLHGIAQDHRARVV